MRKTYDRARMPCRRVLESDFIPEQTKADLEQAYATLNPVKPKREINRSQDRLEALARSKHEAQQNERSVNLEHVPT